MTEKKMDNFSKWMAENVKSKPTTVGTVITEPKVGYDVPIETKPPATISRGRKKVDPPEVAETVKKHSEVTFIAETDDAPAARQDTTIIILSKLGELEAKVEGLCNLIQGMKAYIDALVGAGRPQEVSEAPPTLEEEIYAVLQATGKPCSIFTLQGVLESAGVTATVEETSVAMQHLHEQGKIANNGTQVWAR